MPYIVEKIATEPPAELGVGAYARYKVFSVLWRLGL